MGDNYSVKVYGEGRVYLDYGIFHKVLNVHKLSVNLLSICQIANSSSGKRVEFTPYTVVIFDMIDGSKIEVGEVEHHSRLYSLSHFIN